LYDSIDPEQKSRLTWSCFKDVLQGKCELTYGRLRRIIALIDGNIECNQYLLDEMKSLAQNEYLFDNITLIQHRTARTYDFELPKTHSFWSNGFISHNSSVAMRTCGNSQRAGGRCMWIDAESGFSPDLSVINGCDPSKMIMPDLSACRMKKSESGHFLNANEILEMVYQSAMTGAFDLIVVDSVAALMPERILADDADPMKTGVAEVARAMSDMLKKIVAACKAHETTVIFINQIREKPGVMWGNPETTPGGRALGFYASQRIRVEKISGDRGKVVLCDQDGKESLAGHYARTRIVKNKRNAPCPYDIQIPIYYVQYFPDDAKKAYDAARALQVVTIRQGTLTWKDENKVIILQNDGEADFLEQLRQNATLIYRLAAECVAATDDEANQKKKEPFVLSAAIRDLANTYNPVCPPGATEPKKKKGHATGKKAAAIDLDEIDTSA
jgi:protein RecA